MCDVGVGVGVWSHRMLTLIHIRYEHVSVLSAGESQGVPFEENTVPSLEP